MAAHGWRSPAPVIDWLLAEGWRFEFFQAVRLLEMARPWKSPMGEGVDRDREPARLFSRVSHAFPASDVQEIRPPEAADGPARMEINFLGLAGVTGPLPPPWTDLVVERAKQGDPVLAGFLDIFNHRLGSLFYRTRKALRPGFEHCRPGDTGFAAKVFALVGLATRGLRGSRLGLADGALLRYAALLAAEVRSAKGLALVLADYFAAPADVAPFTGGWVDIEPDQQTRIGRLGQNNALGQEAVLGTRAWDAQSSFRAELGPMPLAVFLDLLPCGSGFAPLCGLARFYGGAALDFTVRLRLAAAEVPGLRLAAVGGPRLGWTSWLATRPAERDAAVTLIPRHWVEDVL